MGEERQVLAAPALMEELILDQRQLEFKENQDVGPTTELAVLKAQETNKIRELYREICGTAEQPSEIDLGAMQEIENGWEALGGNPRSTQYGPNRPVKRFAFPNSVGEVQFSSRGKAGKF